MTQPRNQGNLENLWMLLTRLFPGCLQNTRLFSALVAEIVHLSINDNMDTCQEKADISSELQGE